MIETNATPARGPATQVSQIRQFLNVLQPVVIIFGLLDVFVGVALAHLPAIITGGAIIGYGLLLFAARAQIQGGTTRAALVITCVGLLLAALVAGLVQPEGYPAVLLLPLLVVALALPYVRGRDLVVLMLICWAEATAITLLGKYVRLFPEPPVLMQFLHIGSLVAAFGLLLLLLWQFSSRLDATLAHAQASNVELQAILSEMEARAVNQARLIDENDRQRATIRDLSVPILPIGHATLLLPLVGALDAARLEFVRQQALQAIHGSSARTLLIDITGVTRLDQNVANGLIVLGQAAGLLGVDVGLVGVRAESAQILVGLNIDLTRLHTYRDLEVALAH
jgi:rsbT co-antagonist protein RsbR